MLRLGAPSRWAPFRFASPNRSYRMLNAYCESVLAHCSSIASRASDSHVALIATALRVRQGTIRSSLAGWICPWSSRFWFPVSHRRRNTLARNVPADSSWRIASCRTRLVLTSRAAHAHRLWCVARATSGSRREKRYV